MKEWTLYLKKEGCLIRDYLGTVVADSPKKAIELYFEPKNIKIDAGTSIEITEEGETQNIHEYKDGITIFLGINSVILDLSPKFLDG